MAEEEQKQEQPQEPAEPQAEEQKEQPAEEPKQEPQEEPKEEEAGEAEEKKEEVKEEPKTGPKIFAVRTTANREDQVLDFLSANAEKKKLEVYSVIRPHGMRSYLFVEALNRMEAEQAAFDAPYARGVLPEPVPYEEIEHMVETVKRDVNIQKNDIVEIISGPFKREQAKVTKVDKEKEEVVVELLEAAVPIPITLKTDALKVIRREEL
jgi:transcriptional antiterminator NusG